MARTSHDRKPDPAIRRRRLLALLSGGLVLGVGGTMTLASWNDVEWVWGGAGSDPGVVTSSFVVYQNTQSPADGQGMTNWTEHPSQPGGSLQFTPLVVGDDIQSLTPGETHYSPVALKTSADSMAGTVDLLGAVSSSAVADPDDLDPDGLLWDNLRVRVALQTVAATAPAPSCDADAFSVGTVIVGSAGAATLGTPGTPDHAIGAAGSDVQYYCFELSLPDNATTQTLQGRAVAPAWEFSSTSD